MDWIFYAGSKMPSSTVSSVAKYVINNYLGKFLQYKVAREQLTIDVASGRGTVTDVYLKKDEINEHFMEFNMPVMIENGHIKRITISIPWKEIKTKSVSIDIDGLTVTVKSRHHIEGISVLESIVDNMTSSMQMAQDYLKQEKVEDNVPSPYEASTMFEAIFDLFIKKIKVRFTNTTIRLEHLPNDSDSGAALILKLDNLEYWDEAGTDPPQEEVSDKVGQDRKKAYVISSFATKKFIIDGITLYLEEYGRPSANTPSSESRKDGSENEQEDIEETKDDYFENEDTESEYYFSDSNIPSDELNNDGSVLIGKLTGRQELQLRMKHSEEMSGPKVNIEITTGSLLMFLLPRQFHLINAIISGLQNPDSVDTSDDTSKQFCGEKKMGIEDFKLIEEDLRNTIAHRYKEPLSGLQEGHGWSTASFDENLENLEFQSIADGFPESIMCGSMETSIGSSASCTTSQTSRLNRPRRTETPTEIWHLDLRLTSVAIVLLHENLLTVNASNGPGESPVTAASLAHAQGVVQKFFDNVGLFSFFGYSKKDFEQTAKLFEKACVHNHIRILGGPVLMDFSEKCSANTSLLSGHLTAGRLEIVECLFNNPDIFGSTNPNQENKFQQIGLFSFTSDNPTVDPLELSSKPNLKLIYKKNDPLNKQNKSSIGSKQDVTINLDSCHCEWDITIIDRLASLLDTEDVYPSTPKSDINMYGIQREPDTVNTNCDIRVVCPQLKVDLRFPIVDLRPVYDRDRNPWWHRNVRSDYITLDLDNAEISVGFHSEASSMPIQVKCSRIAASYTEEGTNIPIPVAEASGIEQMGNFAPDTVVYPSFILDVFSIQPALNDLVDVMLTEPESQHEAFDKVKSTSEIPSPFSTKHVVHESHTAHRKEIGDENEEPHELLMPGDKQEMRKFIDCAESNARFRVKVVLPRISVHLASKHLYESLYNRILNDLLLWQPQAPQHIRRQNTLTNINASQKFTLCTSGMNYDSESESEEEQVFYSLHESKQKQLKAVPQQKQNDLTLNIKIGQGILTMNTPIRDTKGNVISGQQGEFMFSLYDTDIFTVSGYDGNIDLAYVCIQARDAVLYHCPMTTNSSSRLLEPGSSAPRHLLPTIYMSEPDAKVRHNSRQASTRDPLMVAIGINANSETHHLKTVKVTGGIRDMTWRYRHSSDRHFFIRQLIDMFDVLDYPVPGYKPLPVLTEMHMHMWDCGIDYRPKDVQLRAFLSVGGFSISSNLTAQTNSSFLRFISEDCYLFLSQNVNSSAVNLMRDYVCVANYDLFEVSIRENGNPFDSKPSMDLFISNNIVHFRTCSDSAASMMSLVCDLASKLSQENEESASDTAIEGSLIESEHNSDLSESQHRHVMEVLNEAMRESVAVSEAVPENVEEEQGSMLFFFPDESVLSNDGNRPLPQVARDLGDVTTRTVTIRPLLAPTATRNSDTDDEFCIVGDEEKDEPPVVTWLAKKPVVIIENYFTVPSDASDQLRAPRSFPKPQSRYTLGMNIVWHIYGGRDFGPAQAVMKRTVNFADEGVSYSKTNPMVVRFEKSSKEADKHWIVKGGPGRNHSCLMELHLSKVRFRRELYDEKCKQESFEVLLLGEVEILDRMSISEINKFLHLWTSSEMPKQTHANMFSLKSVYLKPDPKLKQPECQMKASMLPLRLNIDQDSLLFLRDFFTELNKTKSDEISAPSSRQSTPTHQPPVMTVNYSGSSGSGSGSLASSTTTLEETEHAKRLVSDNLLILLEDDFKPKDDANTSSVPVMSGQGGRPPTYISSFVFDPDVRIRMDYEGKRVDMSNPHGALTGLLLGLGKLNCSELTLKRIHYKHGLLGYEKLISFLLHEWLSDIKTNQLGNLLSGVGPMYAIAQLFRGIRDLFWLPIEQYQKDGRIVRGLQRGANSFTTMTAMAALELTSRIILLIQATAETAYDMVSPGPSVRQLRMMREKKERRRRRKGPPQDIREGMTNAYALVKDGLDETAQTLITVASQEHEQKGYSGAVGGVLRQLPPTVIKPIILATEATNNVLGGMRNQLVPDARREANQKWRNELKE